MTILVIAIIVSMILSVLIGRIFYEEEVFAEDLADDLDKALYDDTNGKHL